jgi:hypothetical protein
MIQTIPAPRRKVDSFGAIATARISGQFPTPEDDFLLDLEKLERATTELLRRTESEHPPPFRDAAE